MSEKQDATDVRCEFCGQRYPFSREEPTSQPILGLPSVHPFLFGSMCFVHSSIVVTG